MLYPPSECAKLIGKEGFEGMIFIGPGYEPMNKELLRQSGIKRALWLDANKDCVNWLYDSMKFEWFVNQYQNIALSDKDNESVFLYHTEDDNESSSIVKPSKVWAQRNPGIPFTKKGPFYSKRFDTFWRENAAYIDLDKFDFIRVGTPGVEARVLRGFGNLFSTFPFKAVYTSVFFEDMFEGGDQVEDVDSVMDEAGFERTYTISPSQESWWAGALYVRS